MRRQIHALIQTAAALLLGANRVESGVKSRPNEVELHILPAEIVLDGPHARQRLIVEEAVKGRFCGQVFANLRSTNESVVRVEEQVAYPVADGSAELTVRVGNRIAKARVTVRGMASPAARSFRNHVQPVLTKAGCNSGACHGAVAGKKGFKLSLRGYDAEGDWLTLTRQARGRRIDLAEPAASLLLRKPTAELSHGGGARFEADSTPHRILSEWIAAGAPGPQSDDPRIVDISVMPQHSTQRVGNVQQLLVLARFSDGRTEDVTEWTKFESTNGEVLQVDGAGKIVVSGHGEGTITAWYLNKLSVANVSVPYANRPADIYASLPQRNFIDELVNGKLQSLGLVPAGPCSDFEFIRRAFLDTIGLLPTPEETSSFVADASPDKRDRLIRQLLQRPEFVDYWTYRWCDLLLVNSEKLDKAAMWSYYSWIRRHVAANTGWDAMVRELVTAQGDTQENGAANFFVLHQDPLELTETISQAFLGMSINCARCHNHPLEKWTNDQYYAMANLIARVRIKENGGKLTVYAAPEGDLTQPLTGKAPAAAPLDRDPIPDRPGHDRRVDLAVWLTDPGNPYFTRAIVNRIWTNFMGVGLVEKVDDLRKTNPASNEDLLSALCNYLVENQYDLRSLMRLILESAAYQRSSVASPDNARDRRFYSRYYPRRLIAEVMLDAISQATGVPTRFSMIPREFAGDPKQFPDYPSGWRALQLPDTKFASYFLQRFGRPERDITCDCERTSEPNVVQVLHLSNGDAINAKLSAPGNQIEKLLNSNATPKEIVERAYMICLSRPPTPSEATPFVEALEKADASGRRPLLEDIFWSLMSSREFLFNH